MTDITHLRMKTAQLRITTSSGTPVDRDLDMPIVAKKICLIWGVNVDTTGLQVGVGHDTLVSIDPDEDFHDSVAPAIIHRQVLSLHSTVGWQPALDWVFFPIPFPCPYGNIRVRVDRGAAATTPVETRFTIYFTIDDISAKDLAIAVVRRGRGETRRVP